MAEQRIFSDLDLTFAKHPVTKDVSKKIKENAVIGAVKNIILTKFGERPFNPNFGSNINSMLFEPIDFVTASILKTEIETAIKNFEPRATIKDLTVKADYEGQKYDVHFSFYIINSMKPITINLLLTRSR